MDNLREKVLIFLDRYIHNFVVLDLLKLNEIKPNKEGLGACAVPTAMTVLATIDLLGFLLNPDGKTDSSGVNIKFYLEYTDFQGQRFFPIYYDKLAIDRLINYRHGMMHHFFPKFRGGFAGIRKGRQDEPLFRSEDGFDPSAASLNVTVLRL